VEARLLTFERVRSFCRSRPVELVISSPPPPFELCLHAGFETPGDFFSIPVGAVQYLDVATREWIGDLRMVEDVREVAGLAAKWSHLPSDYPGRALVFHSSDQDWPDAPPEQLFLVVADRIEFHAGRDWQDLADAGG